MRRIDLPTWPRREHYQVFSTWEYPHFSMCANVDLTPFYPALKKGDISFTIAIMYVIARTANKIPEFRYRMRPGGVIEHELVHPSTTILTGGDLFTFCMVDFNEDFSLFASNAAEQISYVKEHPTLKNSPEGDNLLYMTSIPWVSFTSFMHPLKLNPADSVPRFAWGKFFKEGEALKMPLSVQGHHALMDGIHIGEFYAKFQDYLSHPGYLKVSDTRNTFE